LLTIAAAVGMLGTSMARTNGMVGGGVMVEVRPTMTVVKCIEVRDRLTNTNRKAAFTAFQIEMMMSTAAVMTIVVKFIEATAAEA